MKIINTQLLRYFDLERLNMNRKMCYTASVFLRKTENIEMIKILMEIND